MMSHPNCTDENHTCQVPSGRKCVECGAPAGTLWGPYWCPPCDKKRLEAIDSQLNELADELRAQEDPLW